MRTFDEIVIYGGGSVGLALAALLQGSSDVPVRLYGRGLTAEAVRASGIRVKGLREGTYHVPVMADREPISSRSCLLVCTKAYDLKTVIPQIAGKVTAWPPMIFLQNGFAILDHVYLIMKNCSLPFEPLKAVRAVISLGAEKTGHNEVALHGLGAVYLQESQWSRDLEIAFAAVGLPCEITPDIEKREAVKGVINSILNPLTALYSVRSGELWRQAGVEERMEALIAEDVAVLSSRGMLMEERELLSALRQIASDTAGNVTSMLQDTRSGRETEIEFFNGTLISRAHERGLAVPEHERLYREIIVHSGRKDQSHADHQ